MVGQIVSPAPLATSGRPVARAGLAIAVLLAVVTVFAPVPDGLTPAAKNLAGVFAISLVLWVTEAIPIAVTSLLVIVLQPLFQVMPIGAAASGFMTPVFFFVVAMFCIAKCVVDSGLARRFALKLLMRARTDSRRVVLAFMAGTALMSTVVSDVPVAAVWMSMALPLLDRIGAVPGRSSLGKALMIGIPVASLIGGVATPAGSSINILGLFQIEQFGGVRVTFAQWMAIGVPITLVLTPTAWWILIKAFPPEVPTIGSLDELREESRAMGPLSVPEWKVVLLLTTMVTLWVLSSWVRAIDTTVVAVVGAVVMFLPGINLLTWPATQRETGWDAVLLIGSVTSLGAAAASTGLAKYLVASMPDMTLWPLAGAVALISAITVLIHLPVPVNPAIIGVLVPPLAALAMATDVNAAVYTLPVVFTASCAMLLPLDAVTVITYSKGYYRMTDMLVPGVIISIVWIAVMTVLVSVMAPRVGLL